MKIRNEIDASETNMRDIETPKERIVVGLHPMTDICAATRCEVQHAKPKLSCLDPLPTPLLKSTLPTHIQIFLFYQYLI